MFFNLDKASKQNLLNEYKQEALNYQQKKLNEKQKRIQEEKEYLAKREQEEKEANDKLIREKQERKNAQMEEYQLMLMNTKNKTPGYRYNSFKNKNEIVLNNWGGQEINHSIQNRQENPNQNENQKLSKRNNTNLEVNVLTQGNAELDSPWYGRRGRGTFRNEDHLGNLFNYNIDDKEINKYFRDEKENKQKMYKDLLFSQFQEAKNKNLNLFGTNDPVIVDRKRRRYLSENPYARKDNYEFGKSTLTHNPILDPQNNMDYNKYLRFSESNNNINSNINNYQADNNIHVQQNNNYEQNLGNKNIKKDNTNNIKFDEFKSNNYDTSNMKMGGKSNNFTPIELNSQNNNYNNNINYGGNQVGQSQNNGYMNNSFRPTPSGERIRQAAASNFF